MTIEIEVREWRPCNVTAGELVRLTEAASMLGLSISATSDLTLRGVLTRYRNTEERNPQHTVRVTRASVAAEIKRRSTHHDGRLRRHG